MFSYPSDTGKVGVPVTERLLKLERFRQTVGTELVITYAFIGTMASD